MIMVNGKWMFVYLNKDLRVNILINISGTYHVVIVVSSIDMCGWILNYFFFSESISYVWLCSKSFWEERKNYHPLFMVVV